MELDMNNDRVIADPDRKTIQHELSRLRDDQFAILRKDEFTFIQTLVDPDDGILLEYQGGSPEEHFGTAEPPTMESVISAFISYAEDTLHWKTSFEWVHMEMTEAVFTVIVLVSPDDVNRIQHPLDWQDRLELPDFHWDNLATLYSLISHSNPKSSEAEFAIMGEIHPDGLDAVQLVELPFDFQQALATLRHDQMTPVATLWHGTDYFPDAEYGEDETLQILTELVALAKRALDTQKVLVICLLQ